MYTSNIAGLLMHLDALLIGAVDGDNVLPHNAETCKHRHTGAFYVNRLDCC